ncbi:MAG: MarR family transcriptional regulator [Planctomycetales bacterium]|nr:MarR family transcriptional regulator [Planctomycetales bacterium]NIM09102.1 MarR family transcriptional regulator [Planctomycetales bacterium]NIN08562.1 MarR family transcriptional regulator [Planctomycetales bacterium]NIN77695.1 MarR family transcriptional regulator [Planctomycetales bacterium]NIO34860.1 MarR family transcriptional regulator [Planctomycetales bacterium]
MQRYDFEASIGYWLTLATQAYHRAMSDELAPHGITVRQAQVLGWLAMEGDLSQAALAQRMMVEPPRLAAILDGMARVGWIRRRVCQADRRRKYIQLGAAAGRVGTACWQRLEKSGLKRQRGSPRARRKR